MSYKVGVLLSMIFVAMFFLFGADLITIQSAYSTLDAKANSISYLISRTGIIDDAFKDRIASMYLVDFSCDNNLSPTFGEEIIYTISAYYQPLIISKEKMKITISRMTVVGFYG